MGFETSLFVDQPPHPSFLCHICYEVLKDATTACSNGHAFCKECLKDCVTRCPTCRGSMQKTSCTPLQNMIDALQVKCPNSNNISQDEQETDNASNENDDDPCNSSATSKPDNPTRSSRKRRKTSSTVGASTNNKKNPTRSQTLHATLNQHQNKSQKQTKNCGCPWVGRLSELEQHQSKTCKFQLVPCSRVGCLEKIPRGSFRKHVTSQCLFRPAKCEKCQTSMTYQEMLNHRGNCPKEMTACPYCNKRMLREHLLGKGAPNYFEEDTNNSDQQVAASAAVSRHGRAASTEAVVAVSSFPLWDSSTIGGQHRNLRVHQQQQHPPPAQQQRQQHRVVQLQPMREPFVPTDSECEGHYQVCPNVPLRCEFHKQGCRHKLIPRKRMADHHVQNAQYHAKLVAQAMDDLPRQIEQKLLRKEHVTLVLEVSDYYVVNKRSCLSRYTAIAGYCNMGLKLHLREDYDSPIAVSIRCNSHHHNNNRNDFADGMNITDIRICIRPSLNEEPAIPGFSCPGPRELEPKDDIYAGCLQFKTHLAHQQKEEDTAAAATANNNTNVCVMNGRHLLKMLQTNHKLYVLASFAITKNGTRYLGRVESTCSPSPSPSRSPSPIDSPSTPSYSRDDDDDDDDDNHNPAGYDSAGLPDEDSDFETMTLFD